MKRKKIEIINKSKNELPSYKTEGSVGVDLRANLNDSVGMRRIPPRKRMMIPTGLYISLPFGVEAQIRPRSGLANKYGVTVLNTPGTIDSDYRGEIMVILINHGEKDFIVEDGDRIAQMVFSQVELIDFESVTTLDKTTRSGGGFGHTGVK